MQKTGPPSCPTVTLLTCVPPHDTRSSGASSGFPVHVVPNGVQHLCGHPSWVNLWEVGQTTNMLTPGLINGQEIAVWHRGSKLGVGAGVSCGKRNGRVAVWGPATLLFQPTQ